MMDNQEAAALLIKNIGMFEQATLLINEIGEKVDKEVNKKIKGWVGNSSDAWVFDDAGLDKAGTLTFTHKSCVKRAEDDKDSWIAYFCLSAQGDEEDQWWLASYCGQGKRRFGICFEFDYGLLGVKQSQLRKFLSKESEKYSKLQEIGFEFQGSHAGWWFLPFQLDAEKLALSYAGEVIEDALDPIEDALIKVEKAWPAFKMLIEATAKEFSNSGT